MLDPLPLISKENWWDRSNSFATATLFILTVTLQPNRVNIELTVTGQRAESTVEDLSSGSFLRKG